MKKILLFGLICMLSLLPLTGCGGNKDNNPGEETPPAADFKDGTYHAEYDRPDVRNWVAYVDVTVKDGKITKAYYDYTNEAGEKRTENKGYIEGFSAANEGMTPREAFDELGVRLVDKQDIEKVDAVSGATHSSRNFNELVGAALENAMDGSTSDAVVALYEDGLYRVEGDAFDDYGWKPFVEVQITDGDIAGVTFDSENEAGDLKSKDQEYKKNMEAKTGTYPEKYSSELQQRLIDKQIISQVDAVTGATQSSNDFTALVEYALDDMAEVGDTQTAVIKLDETE
ncbi:MAG: putative lipoprotein [Bacillota bacterium]|jgi:major membrane immunogen (membrane-anchored lipoprotein)|nr:putative lipoprotein [Bacillota bacterium]